MKNRVSSAEIKEESKISINLKASKRCQKYSSVFCMTFCNIMLKVAIRRQILVVITTILAQAVYKVQLVLKGLFPMCSLKFQITIKILKRRTGPNSDCPIKTSQLRMKPIRWRIVFPVCFCSTLLIQFKWLLKFSILSWQDWQPICFSDAVTLLLDMFFFLLLSDNIPFPCSI